MKVQVTGWAAIPTIFLMLFYMAWGLGIFGLSIYGVVLAFSASVVLGILSIFVQPAPLIFGAGKFLFGVNLPVMIMAWLHAHGA